MSSASKDRPVVLSLKDVSMRFGQKTVLSDVSFNVLRNEFLAITGPNGGGKTTLLRIILRLLKPTSGTINYHGNPTVGYLPQKNMIDSHFPISVRELIRSGLMCRSNRGRRTVNEILTLTGLEALADQTIGTLSGGQLQRALFGRAIISRPELLVLDEPLSYLDTHFEHKLYNILEEVAADSTVVLVSHQMSTIADMATRHIVVDGTAVECPANHHHYIAPECNCTDCSHSHQN
ncbi:MAG: ATP-binding cassette domain-containing protein [Muribaculaceae bacterium]|nr:ATP-binding cassette domain-containing protein [Muribaculaceae bacterium]